MGTTWPPVGPMSEGFQVGAEGSHVLVWAGLQVR